MITKGTLLRVKTRTKDDVFGECLYEVVEVGLSFPGRKVKDGVKCVILGGSGPAARRGYTVHDSVEAIERNITEGITTIVPAEQRASIVAHYEGKKPDGAPRGLDIRHGGAGVVEVP